MKRFFSLILALILCISLASCATAENNTEMRRLPLGTSSFTMIVPEGFNPSYDTLEPSQTDRFANESRNASVNIYQWNKGGVYLLDEVAEISASEKGATLEEITLNGVTLKHYTYSEEENFIVDNFMFEDETYIVEVSYRCPADGEPDIGYKAMETLQVIE